MNAKKVKLDNLNKIDDEFIVNCVEKGKGIIKVTSTTYYTVYEGDSDPKRMEELAKEWFEQYGHTSHAYRDGGKLPFENLINVELLKR
jgi:hypothetical protein